MSKLQLTNEVKYYEKHKDSFLKLYKNKFIVIKNEELTGPFLAQYDAYAAGIEKYGNHPFLIKFVSDIPKAPEQAPALWVGSITTN